MKNGFRAGGRGVFKCIDCGKRTREVDVFGPELCPKCLEIAGIENELSDGEHSLSLSEKKSLMERANEIREQQGRDPEYKFVLVDGEKWFFAIQGEV